MSRHVGGVAVKLTKRDAGTVLVFPEGRVTDTMAGPGVEELSKTIVDPIAI
jgi:hypothetical protein